MAIVPGKSIMEFWTLKPSSITVWCLLCDVKNAHLPDVYLDLGKVQKAGIEKSAYYAAFAELESKDWIRFSQKADGKKWFTLIKGFEATENKEDSTNTENNSENSVNVENDVENYSVNAENSTNVEKQTGENSANVESHIRNIIPSEYTQDSYESFAQDACACEPSESLAVVPPSQTEIAVVENLFDFRRALFGGICDELSVRKLPNKDDWFEPTHYAFSEGYSPALCLEVFRLMRAQKWRKSPVGPKDWLKNLSNLENLRKEIAEQNEQPKQSEFQTERERRGNAARERIEFDRLAEEHLRQQGII